MKYLYADSTEFPPQKDFLELLDNFLETGARTIALENTVFDLKENIRDRRRLKNSVLGEMDTFLVTVENSISEAVAQSDEKEAITQYAEMSKSFVEKFIEEGKKNFSDELFHEITSFEEKIDKADEENKKTLEAFFIQDPIPAINKKYTIKAIKKGYFADVYVDYEENISSKFELATFELPFWDSHVRTSDFLKDIEIPARMKKPLLKKELVPDIVNINDYYLTNVDYHENSLDAVFKKKLTVSAERVRMKMDLSDKLAVAVFYAEENGVEKDIQAIPELKTELNINRLHELGEKIAAQTESLYSKKQRLEAIYVNGKDVFEQNLMFDLMQNTAKIFAPTVKEIKNRSPSKEELSLKIEDDTGKRSEIYLKKSRVKEKLDGIKDKGDRLLEILGI